MHRLTAAIILTASMLIGCSFSPSQRATESVAHTERRTASDQADLVAGVRRIQAFKQELLDRGLRVTSTSTSDSQEYVTFNGKYGKLRDLEITLWTSTTMDIQKNDSHIGASAHAQLGTKAEEDEFGALKQHLREVVNDMK